LRPGFITLNEAAYRNSAATWCETQMKAVSSNEKTGTDVRILSTAAVRFAQFGYNGVSTREIASDAGVNEVTIYRHYPNKRNLYLAVLDSELAKVNLREAPDEFRWWNLLNIIQVLRRGDAKSRHIAWKHWKKAFGPGGIGRAIKALNDVLYVRFHRKLDI